MTSFSEGTAAWPAKTWLSGVGKVCENGKVSACCLFAVPLFVVQSDLAGRTDPTFVLAAENAEEAILAPLRRPAVRDDPVLGVVLDAPADNLHGVATLDGVPHLEPNSLLSGNPDSLPDGKNSLAAGKTQGIPSCQFPLFSPWDFSRNIKIDRRLTKILEATRNALWLQLCEGILVFVASCKPGQ